MKEPRRYLHIGFPKCASTSLQNFYFASHPECYHLGLGYKSKGNRYIAEDVEMVSEVDVRLKKRSLFDPELSLSRLRHHFDDASTRGFAAVGLSNEFFSFTMANEVDPADKAERLHHLFGPNTAVIIVIREQFSLLRSLYLELVKGGYPGTYRNFLEYTLLYQVRSWCHDFCFDTAYETYEKLFGRENICIVPMELLKADTPAFLARIASALGIGDTIHELRSVNTVSDTLGFYEQLRRFNARYPHEFGSAFFEPFSMNRMRAYFHNELGLAVPHDRLADDSMRQAFHQAALKFNQLQPLPDIDLSVPAAFREEFEKIYAPSNSRLQQKIDINLSEFGYVMT